MEMKFLTLKEESTASKLGRLRKALERAEEATFAMYWV